MTVTQRHCNDLQKELLACSIRMRRLWIKYGHEAASIDFSGGQRSNLKLIEHYWQRICVATRDFERVTDAILDGYKRDVS